MINIMRKIRLYLDTSPIIMIGPDQDPIRRTITEEFFRIVAERADEYELFVSRVTLDEINKTKSGEKRLASAEFLNSIAHTPGDRLVLTKLSEFVIICFSLPNTCPKRT